MAKISHTLEYWGAASGIAIAQALPAKLADKFGSWLGSAAGLVLRSRRKIAMENLRRAMLEHTEEQRKAIVDEVFRNTGRTLVEFARFGTLGIAGVKRLVPESDCSEITEAMEKGRGGIILTAHFGCWELLGAWAGTFGYQMDFLMGTQHNEKVDNLLVGLRKGMGFGVIRLSTSARSVFKALKQNHLTGMVADQHASSGSLIVPFFGRPASSPRGPAVFAIRANCPLLPMMLKREQFNRHVVIKGKPIYPPNSGDEEADIRSMTEEYTAFFEATIRKYPGQWLWTHRRWKVD